MKILRIRFENINSLKGLHEIDFTEKPLASAGLLAITGPTGSGKSTILDVITLALFNRIPRITGALSKSVIEQTGLIITRNMNDCFAEIRYESKAGVFTSRWSIKKAKTGNLKDYEMELAGADGSLFPLKKSEVPDKNEELIGLSFDQFVKAIVLAQGDFAAFLKAKKGDREKLLEQVTGSWIYRKIGKAAYDRSKELGQELSALLESENRLKEKMLDEEGYEKLSADLEHCNSEISGIQRKITMLAEEKKLKKEIADLVKKIEEQTNSESETMEGQRRFLELNGERLGKHRKLIPYQKRLWEWQRLGKEVNEGGAALENIRQDIKKCLDGNAAIAAEVRELTGSDGDVIGALSGFDDRVTALEREKAEKDTIISGRIENMKELAAELAVTVDFSDIETDIEVIEAEIEENSDVVRTLITRVGTDRASNPDEELLKLKAFAEEARNYKTEKAVLDEKVSSLSEESEAMKKLQQETAALPGLLTEARLERDKALHSLEILEKDARIRDLTASLEDHRKKLRYGDPCPLCGSVEHPYVTQEPEFQDDLDERIIIAKKERERCSGEVTKLENSLAVNEKSLKEKEQKIAGLTKEYEKLRDTCNSIVQKIPEEFRLSDPQEMIAKITSVADDLESLVGANTKERKLRDLRKKYGELSSLVKVAGDLAAKRNEIFKGDDVHRVTSEYSSRYASNLSLSEKLSNDEKVLKEKLDADRCTLNGSEAALRTDIEGYESITDALADIIDGEDYQALDEADKKFSEDLRAIGALLDESRRILTEHKKNDTVRTMEEIEAEIVLYQTAVSERNQERDGFVTAKTLHDSAVLELEKISSVITDQKKKNQKWVLLDSYIGDAEGKRFSVFAQQLTLFQLIKLANRRMDLLSDRYRLDMPGKDEDDSLAVIDRHMGDLRRSVKSLSGGETFLVSLSLALALSDLASRQVEIKSLFIDEGFGSLDKVTLDQTIDTLERLQNETSKTIGVISHIEAMQERITTQIRLTRNGQGYSSVEIVG
jgi:exonuclease SbcC